MAAVVVLKIFCLRNLSTIALEVVTPKSDTILPSITRRSLMYVAEKYLGLKAVEREVFLEELSEFKECALCGTAAVLSPVGKIVDHGKEILIPFI